MYEIFFRHRSDSPRQIIVDDGSLKDIIFLLETSNYITEYMVCQGHSTPAPHQLGLTKKYVYEFDYQKEW